MVNTRMMTPETFYGGAHTQNIGSLFSVKHVFARLLTFNPTGTNRTVFLPKVVLKVKLGGPIFYIRCPSSASNNLFIIDQADSLLATLTPGDVAVMCCLDNSTNAGVWYLKVLQEQ